MSFRVCQPGRKNRHSLWYCHEEKPTDDFYNDDMQQCITCRSAEAKAKRKEKRYGADAHLINSDQKKCHSTRKDTLTCGRIATSSEFRPGRSQCNACYLQSQRQRAQAKRDAAGSVPLFVQPKNLPDGFRMCRVCHEQKEMNQMADHDRGGEGKRNICKDCRRVQKRVK